MDFLFVTIVAKIMPCKAFSAPQGLSSDENIFSYDEIPFSFDEAQF